MNKLTMNGSNKNSWLLINFILITLVELTYAQTEFGYNSHFEPTAFIQIDNQEKLKLPEEGKITIFYFPFFDSDSRIEMDYFISISNCFSLKEISIYNVLLDSCTFQIKGLTSISPTKPEVFQWIWERNLQNNINYILLIDQENNIKYIGGLGSPEKFSSILEKLGLNFYFPNPILKNILKRYGTLVNLLSNKVLNYNQLINNRKPKLIFFYRSLCTPCGEHLLIKELSEIIYEQSLDLTIILIFRYVDERQLNVLMNIIDETPVKLNEIYETNEITPDMERFFLQANPLLLYFSSDNKFKRARAGNTLGKKGLERFLQGINEHKIAK